MKTLQRWAYNGRGWQRFYAQHVMWTKISLTLGKQLNESRRHVKKILKVAIKNVCDACILLKFVREMDHTSDDHEFIK